MKYSLEVIVIIIVVRSQQLDYFASLVENKFCWASK